MILDSSAILAILLTEPGYERLLERIFEAPVVGVGAPTLVEVCIVLSARLGIQAAPLVERFLREADAEVLPFSGEHYEAAREAFFRFGKGRHPAALNFGDCLAYAISRVSGFPLLFVGADFLQTDITAA